MKRPSDFQQFMGSPVLLKTYKPVNGRKEFAGRLAGYDNGAVELDMGTAQPLRFEKQDIALVRLRVEFFHIPVARFHTFPHTADCGTFC